MNLSQDQIDRLGNKDWRLRNLWHIKDKNQKLVVFKLNRAQKHFYHNKHTRNIILKSRQLGFSTFEAIDILDDVAFSRNYDALLIAQDLETAKDIFDNKIWLAWDKYKLATLYKLNTESARQIKLDKTLSSITVDNSGRSGTYRRVHISEFGLICKKYPDKAREVIEGTVPAVPVDGRIDIESTAEGSEGRFYDMFWEAYERGEPTIPTQWKAHFYNWQWDDEEISKVSPFQVSAFINSKDFQYFKEIQDRYKINNKDLTYYYFKWLALNRDWHALKTQYPTTPWEAFQSSGNKLFDEAMLSKQDIRSHIRTEGNWKIYSEPLLGHKYIWGADVGEGVGRDSSTVVIMDRTTLKPTVVATYQNNYIAPDLFAHEIRNMCLKYNHAFGAPERNNHGHTVISKLREIYNDEFIWKDDKGRQGWHTNLVSKPAMFYDLNTAINNELIDLTSKELLSEARRYDRESVRSKLYDEDSTEHFDLITALAICFQMKNFDTVYQNVAKVFYGDV